ncbi:MAG: hypothetical protein WAZ14_04140 [Patescibacteria group bacterium]
MNKALESTPSAVSRAEDDAKQQKEAFLQNLHLISDQQRTEVLALINQRQLRTLAEQETAFHEVMSKYQKTKVDSGVGAETLINQYLLMNQIETTAAEQKQLLKNLKASEALTLPTPQRERVVAQILDTYFGKIKADDQDAALAQA